MSVQVCFHVHVSLCMGRAAIAPARINASCEELVSMEGSVPPAARVWSRSGLAKYTAAGSLVSAADNSKQHKNVGAAPPPSFPLFVGLARPTTLQGLHPSNKLRAALGPREHTCACVHHRYVFWGACVGKVWAAASCPAWLWLFPQL